MDHGFYPTSFAYREGAYDATAESIVHDCGYTSARAAGGIDVAGLETPGAKRPNSQVLNGTHTRHHQDDAA